MTGECGSTDSAPVESPRLLPVTECKACSITIDGRGADQNRPEDRSDPTSADRNL